MSRHLHRIVLHATRRMRLMIKEAAAGTEKGATNASVIVRAVLATFAALAPMLIGAVLAGMLSTISVDAQIVGVPEDSLSLSPAVLGARSIGLHAQHAWDLAIEAQEENANKRCDGRLRALGELCICDTGERSMKSSRASRGGSLR